MANSHPANWHVHRGPNEWYRLWHPPSWQAADSDGTLCLRAPDGGTALVVHAFWRSDWPQGDLADVVDLTELFPNCRSMRRLSPLAIDRDSVGFEGETDTAPAVRWWKRPFSTGRWRRWRLWAVRDRLLGVLAVLQPAEECDPETLSLAAMVLNTLEFPEDIADPPEEFARRVLELARRRFPLLECRSAGEFQLHVGESSLNLFNFYRAYVKAPDKFEEIVLPALTTVVQVQEWGDAQTEPQLDDVRDRILPMLYPRSVWQQNFPNFVGLPWVAGLIVLYVVDEAHAYWYIRDDLLSRWGLSPPELHDLALANLDGYFEQNPTEFMLAGNEDGGPRLLMPNLANAYNCSRILSETFHERLRDVLGRQFAVGIPGRDFFVAVSLDDQSTLSQVRRQVAQDYAHMDHPLTDRLLLVSPDGVSELVPE